MTSGDGILDAGDDVVIPGLIDIQVNGALNWTFRRSTGPISTPSSPITAAGGQRRCCPRWSPPVETLTQSLRVLADYLDDAPNMTLPGIHLEGPFLAPEKSGAHDPAALTLPGESGASLRRRRADGFRFSRWLPNCPARCR
ncbi:MAG: hypothetical protein R2856_23470 [Caldilineaceae bacterium]